MYTVISKGLIRGKSVTTGIRSMGCQHQIYLKFLDKICVAINYYGIYKKKIIYFSVVI